MQNLTSITNFAKFRVRRPGVIKRQTGRQHGDVAQLGERCNGIAEVRGSIPLVSTNKIRGSLDLLFRIVRNCKKVACAVVGSQHPHDFVKTKRSGAAAAEDGDLVAAFVGGAVAVEAF